MHYFLHSGIHGNAFTITQNAYYSSFCPPAGGIAPRPVFTPFVGVVMHSVYWIRYWSGRSVAPVTLHLSVCLSRSMRKTAGTINTTFGEDARTTH